MAIDTEQTVGDLVRGNPSAVGVFEAFGIDYCCGGRKPLAEACRSAGVPVQRVLGELEEVSRIPPIQEDCHWLTCSLVELTAHIVNTHHAYSRQQLPVLISLAAKVVRRHGATKPELIKLQEYVEALAQELNAHMTKEEEVLFPIFRRLQEGADRGWALDFHAAEALLGPIRHMMEDHDDAGELLRQIKLITNGFDVPDGACNTFRALYELLQNHEMDLHRHIHLENNILFPRALEMARSRGGKVA